MTAEKKTAPFLDDYMNAFQAGVHMLSAMQNAAAGMTRYQSDFLTSYLLSTVYFQRADLQKMVAADPQETFQAYATLGMENLDLVRRGVTGAIDAASQWAETALSGTSKALGAAAANGDLKLLLNNLKQQADLMALMAWGYPQAIEAIGAEYGFHFERVPQALVEETDRFCLYRVPPSKAGVETRFDRKPILIVPPYVLGANILGFLPGEDRSYAHCYANQGIPTYVRILKDIAVCEPLQTMSAEDDALDTRRFCETLHKLHGRPVTLNGYCQGGFNALCALLSGELDGLVDAFITCVSPMDGTRSTGLSGFLERLPERFNDLDYGTKMLPNGNRVADGRLMGWVYKLKSIETESPAAACLRDLTMLFRTGGDARRISKTAAALNHWLANERNDLPLAITQMSFASYNTPITKDGTLPVKLFGRPLNLKRLKEMKLPWLICYGLHDDLVEKETALAPLDFVPAEVTAFPKGHVAIATSWSDPNSACALHTRFGEEQSRGPVRFQLDLDAGAGS